MQSNQNKINFERVDEAKIILLERSLSLLPGLLLVPAPCDSLLVPEECSLGSCCGGGEGGAVVAAKIVRQMVRLCSLLW